MQDLIAELERRLTPRTDDLVSALEARLAAPAPAPAPAAPRPQPPISTPRAVALTEGVRPTLQPMAPMPSHRRADAPVDQVVKDAAFAVRNPRASRVPLVREFMQGAESAAVGVGEAVTGLAHMAGLASDQTLQSARQASEMVAPEVAATRIADDPAATLGNPAWWAAMGGQAAGSMTALGSVGTITRVLTAAKYAPAVVSAVAESLTEGGAVYSDALSRGATPEQAAAAAAKVAAVNLPLLGVTNIPIFNASGRGLARDLVTSGASESGQEVAQQLTSNVAARGYDPNQSLTEGLLESGVVGAMAGPAATAALRGTSRPAPQPPQPAPARPGRTPLTGGDPARLAAVDQAAAAHIAAIEARLAAPTQETTPTVEPVSPNTDVPGITDSVNPDVQATQTAPPAAPVDAASLIESLEQRVTPTPPAAPQAASGVEAPALSPADELEQRIEEDAAPTPAPTEPPAKFSDLLPTERREVRRIAKELEAFSYEEGRMQRIPEWEPDKDDARVSPRMANAAVLHAINRGKSRTGVQVKKAVERYIEGRGRPTSVTLDVLRAARDRAAGRLHITGPHQLPQDAGETEGEIYISPRRTGKPDAAKEIETIRRLDTDGQTVIDAYLERFGGVFNADNASEILGPHEGEKRWAHHDAVRSSASAMVQRLYNDALSEPVDPNADVVVLTGGGTGSGKSSVLSNLQPDTAFVLDSTLADYKGSKANVERARQSGRPVAISFTYRDPIDAFTNGVLSRLTDPENGRPVTTFTHASTHVNAPKTVLQLAEDYADAFDVAIMVNENATGREPVARDIAWLREQAARYTDRDVLRARLEDALAAEVDAGRVTPEQARRVSQAERFRQSAPAGHDVSTQRPVTPAQRAPSEVTRKGTGATQGESVSASPTRNYYNPPPASEATSQQPARGRPMSGLETTQRMRHEWVDDHAGTKAVPQPLREGRMGGRRALGLYFTETDLIRLADPNDVPTFVHELGHALSFKWLERYGKPVGLFADELMKLGASTTRRGQSKSYQLEEGVAEFFRVYVADRAQARAEAPGFAKAFEEVLAQQPDLARRIRNTQDIARRWNRQSDDVRAEAQTDIKPVGLKNRVRSVREELRATRDFSKPFPQRLYDAITWTGQMPSSIRQPQATVEGLVMRWFDSNTAAARAMKDVAGKRGGPLRPSEMADVISKVRSRADAIAESMLLDDVRNRAGQIMGPALKPAIDKVRQHLDPSYDGSITFPQVLHALRAEAIHHTKHGVDPGLSPAQVDSILRRAKAHKDADALLSAAETVNSHTAATRDWMFEWGGLTKELHGTLKETPFYVPLQRVMDTLEGRAGGAAGTPIKKQTGSGRPVQNPVENIVHNLPAMVRWTLDNAAIGTMAKTVSETPGMGHLLVEVPPDRVPVQFNLDQIKRTLQDRLAKDGIDISEVDLDIAATVFVPPFNPSTKDRIVTWLDGGPDGTGKRRYFQVQDEGLWRWMETFGPQNTAPLFWGLRFIKASTRLFRAGATQTLSFSVGANIWRDTLTAMLQSRYGFVPIIDNLHGFKSLLMKDENYRHFLAGGGRFGSLHTSERSTIEKWTRETLSPQKKSVARWLLPWNLVRIPFAINDAIGYAMESSVRLGERRLAMVNQGNERKAGVIAIAQRVRDRLKGSTPVTRRQGLTDVDLQLLANQAAQDVTLPFREGGTVARDLNQYIPFFNAMLLGGRESIRVIRERPTEAMLTLAALMLIKAWEWEENKDDEYYQGLPPNQKRNYFWARTGPESWFTMPMIQGPLGAPVTATGVVLDALANEGSVDLNRRISQVIRENRYIVFNFLPYYGQFAAQVQSGYDFYRDRPIVSPYDQGKDPDLQVRPSSSSLSRVIGHVTGQSPLVVDQVGYGLQSNRWRDISKAMEKPAEATLTAITGRKQPARPADSPTQGPLGVVTGAARLLRSSDFHGGDRRIQEFWEEYRAIESARASLRDRERGKGIVSHEDAVKAAQQRFPGGQWEQTRAGSWRLVVPRMDTAYEQIDRWYDEIARYQGDLRMSPEEKRLALSFAYRQIVQHALQGLGKPPLKN